MTLKSINNELVKKMCNMYTIEYYSILKNKGILQHVRTKTKPSGFMLVK